MAQRHLSSRSLDCPTPPSRKPACRKLPRRIDGRKDRSFLIGPGPHHYCFGQLSGMQHVRHDSCCRTKGVTSTTPPSSCGDCRHAGSAPCRLQAPSWTLPRAEHSTEYYTNGRATPLHIENPNSSYTTSETLGQNGCLQDPTPASPPCSIHDHPRSCLR